MTTYQITLIKCAGSVIIFVFGMFLSHYTLDVLRLSNWFGLLIPGTVGCANLFLHKTTEHDHDVDVLRSRKLDALLD